MTRCSRALQILVWGGLLATGLDVRAAPLRIEGVCPSGEAVRMALDEALGRVEAERLWTAPEPIAEVNDEGPFFVVKRGVQLRRVEDPERDCEARARNAAVFVALALSLEAAQPAALEVEARSSPLPPEPPRWRAWQVHAAGAMEWVPGLGPTAGALLAAIAPWRPHLRWVAQLGAGQSIEGRLSGTSAEEQRVLVRAGAETFVTWGPLGLNGHALASLAWARWRLPDLPDPRPDAAFTPGSYLGGRVDWGRSRWRPFLQLGVEWLPRAPVARLLPETQLETPGWRVASQIGVAVTIP